MSYQRPQFAILSSRLDELRRLIQVVAGSRQVGKTTLVVRSSKTVTVRGEPVEPLVAR